MSPGAVLRDAAADGVQCSLKPDGRLALGGPKAAIEKWLPHLREHKAGLLALLAANDAEPITEPDTVPRDTWLLHRADGRMDRLVCSPPATWAEVLAQHPDALAVEPCPAPGTTPEPLTPDEANEIRAYLDAIGETDQEIRDHVRDQCRRDPAANALFLADARGRQKV